MAFLEKLKETGRALADSAKRLWETPAGLGQPAANTREDKDAYTIAIDLPGVHKDEVKISVRNGVLHLRAERRETREEKGAGWQRVESFFGVIERAFPLPPEADEEKIDAQMKDGVLTLKIGIDPAKKPRSIEVK